jgi:hypothetical protein
VIQDRGSDTWHATVTDDAGDVIAAATFRPADARTHAEAEAWADAVAENEAALDVLGVAAL